VGVIDKNLYYKLKKINEKKRETHLDIGKENIYIFLGEILFKIPFFVVDIKQKSLYNAVVRNELCLLIFLIEEGSIM
jgi:hypothetical protein